MGGRAGGAAAGKPRTAKLVFVCVGLLGAALVADLLWASSTSSSSSAAFRNWAVPESSNVIFPNQTNNLPKVAYPDKSFPLFPFCLFFINYSEECGHFAHFSCPFRLNKLVFCRIFDCLSLQIVIFMMLLDLVAQNWHSSLTGINQQGQKRCQ